MNVSRTNNKNRTWALGNSKQANKETSEKEKIRQNEEHAYTLKWPSKNTK